MSRNRTNYNNKYNSRKENRQYEETVIEPIEEIVEEVMDDKVLEPYEEPIENATTVVLGKVNIPENKSLNVRSEKSKDSEALTTINCHSEVVILDGREDSGDWYKICTASGIEGYVLKEYISGIHNTII